MKNVKLIASFLIAIVLVAIASFGVYALDTADRIRAKFKRLQTAVNQLAKEQLPIADVMASIVAFKKYLDAGDAVRAEATLDAMLKRREIAEAQTRIGTPTPKKNGIKIATQAANEPLSDAFQNSQLVEVIGYSDQAMEPCITPDGQYLLFNNSNAPKESTHIHLTRRIDKNKFQYVGVLPGTVSGSKDMAPSIDRSGDIYFTSLRSYEKDMNSLYVGRFDGASVREVRMVSGAVTPTVPCWINMDCCISEDGNSLVISRARFDVGSIVPSESDLLLFEKVNGVFMRNRQDLALMKQVNTPALEYAPSLSSDRLTLYFTRTQETPSGKKNFAPLMRILMSKRKSIDQPFAPPEVIKEISGLVVEAPTLPTSGRELFYHKMDNGRFKIFRCDRKN